MRINEKTLWKSVIIIWVLVLIVCIIRLSTITHATSLDKETIFQHNGTQFETGSFIYKGRIFVPLRMLSEQLGYKVKWNGQDKTINISNNNQYCQFQLDSKFIYKYNQDSVQMDVIPLVIDGTTYIPVRYAVESLGKFIELYDSEKLRIINITDNKPIQEVVR